MSKGEEFMVISYGGLNETREEQLRALGANLIDQIDGNIGANPRLNAIAITHIQTGVVLAIESLKSQP